MANGYTENAIEGRNLSVTCPYTFGEPTLLYFPGLNPIYCSDTMVIFYGFQTQKERTQIRDIRVSFRDHLWTRVFEIHTDQMFYGNNLRFSFCNKHFCSYFASEICIWCIRQCRLSSLYMKRNLRRKSFKESSSSDSNFTDMKNRSDFI